MTPTSVIHVMTGRPGRIAARPAGPVCLTLLSSNRERHDRGQHRDDAEHHHGQLQRRRRGDEPGVDVDAGGQSRLGGHLQVGEDPGDLRLLLRCECARWRRGYRRSRRPTCPTLAQMCSVLQLPADHRTAWRHRGHRVAERDEHHVGGGADEQAALGRVAGFLAAPWTAPHRPPAGSVAMAWQGMEMSSACGAPDTSGAVMSETMPFGPGACGHAMVAVVCLTGSSGTSAQSRTPAMPATTATSRAMADSPVRSGSSRGTRVDVRRRC